MAHDVFISHSHEDKPAADAACAALEARGCCWVAPRDIDPGQDWAASIVAAIHGAQIMLLVFSQHANQSPQVQREVERAASSGKVILPLRVDDVLPEAALAYYLGTPHWLDAITKPFEAHLEKLADACASLLAVTGGLSQDATSDSAPTVAPHLTDQPQSPMRGSGSASAQPADHQPPAMSWWGKQRRRMKVGVIAATVVILAAATGITGYFLRPDSPVPHTATAQPAPAPAPTSSTPPPVPADGLEGLLLSPDEIDATMGATGMIVDRKWNTFFDVGTNPAVPPECLPVGGAAEAGVYAGSGSTAVRGQTLREPGKLLHVVDQGVVLFPSAQAATAFASASAQSWFACANLSYSDTSRNNLRWSVGPVSTVNGTISATTSEQSKTGWACQRALTASNNVVIDVAACSYKTTDEGISIAGQIGAKVPT